MIIFGGVRYHEQNVRILPSPDPTIGLWDVEATFLPGVMFPETTEEKRLVFCVDNHLYDGRCTIHEKQEKDGFTVLVFRGTGPLFH